MLKRASKKSIPNKTFIKWIGLDWIGIEIAFLRSTHFKLILHSIRNLCKFAEPFAIQYAAIITDGYSSDCFQLIFFHSTWICKSVRTNKASDWACHIRFILHCMSCSAASLWSRDETSLMRTLNIRIDFYSLNEYPSKINKTILLISMKSIFSLSLPSVSEDTKRCRRRVSFQ